MGGRGGGVRVIFTKGINATLGIPACAHSGGKGKARKEKQRETEKQGKVILQNKVFAP